MKERDIRLIQVGSGVYFSTFAVAHVANHLFAFSGPLGYDEVQSVLRTVYQNPLIEATVFSSLAVHIATGWRAMSRRWKADRVNGLLQPKLDWQQRLHRYSGWFLSAAIFAHVAGTRGQEWLTGRRADFKEIARTLRQYPYIFYPWYLLLGTTAVYHLCYGLLDGVRIVRGRTIKRTSLDVVVPLISTALSSLLASAVLVWTRVK